MGFTDFHTYNINQTAGKNTYQLSATGGTLHSLVTLSGNATGFLSIYDSNNALPLPISGRTVISGALMPATRDSLLLEAELNSGLYIEAVGPVNVMVTWA